MTEVAHRPVRANGGTAAPKPVEACASYRSISAIAFSGDAPP